MKFRITKLCNERAVNQSIYVRKQLAEAFVSEYIFVCESGITPDILAGLLLDAAGQFSECLNLIEGISSRESNICEFISLDDLQDLVYRDFPASMKIP